MYTKEQHVINTSRHSFLHLLGMLTSDGSQLPLSLGIARRHWRKLHLSLGSQDQQTEPSCNKPGKRRRRAPSPKCCRSSQYVLTEARRECIGWIKGELNTINKLNEGEFTDLGALSRETGFHILTRILGDRPLTEMEMPEVSWQKVEGRFKKPREVVML